MLDISAYDLYNRHTPKAIVLKRSVFTPLSAFKPVCVASVLSLGRRNDDKAQ